MRILKYRKTRPRSASTRRATRVNAERVKMHVIEGRHRARDARRRQGQGRQGAARLSRRPARHGRRHQHREEAPQGADAPRSRAESSRCRRRCIASNVMLLDPKRASRRARKARIDDGWHEGAVGVKSGEADSPRRADARTSIHGDEREDEGSAKERAKAPDGDAKEARAKAASKKAASAAGRARRRGLPVPPPRLKRLLPEDGARASDGAVRLHEPAPDSDAREDRAELRRGRSDQEAEGARQGGRGARR